MCTAAALQDSNSGLLCANCESSFAIDSGVIDLRTTESPQYVYPFYASSSFRIFSDRQAELHQEHYRPGSFSNADRGLDEELVADHAH